MADQKQLLKAMGMNRSDMFTCDPDKLVIVDDVKSGFCHSSRNVAPLVEALVLNIMAFGVIEPVQVRLNGSSPEVIDGRRRVLHAREANKRLRAAGGDAILVPCIVKRGAEVDLVGVAAASQMHEEESPIEKARHIQRLIDRGWPVERAAIAIGVTIHRAKELLPLLQTSDVVQKALENGQLTASAAKHIVKLPHEEQEKRVKDLVEGAKEKKTKGEKKPKKATAADAREAAGLIVAPAKRRLSSISKLLMGVKQEYALLIEWFLGRMTDKQIAQELPEMRKALAEWAKTQDKE